MTSAQQESGPLLAGREIPRAYRDVVNKLVRHQGWRYDPRRDTGGHPQLIPANPDQRMIPINCTVGYGRGIDNWLAQIVRAGGVLRPVVKKRRRSVRPLTDPSGMTTATPDIAPITPLPAGRPRARNGRNGWDFVPPTPEPEPTPEPIVTRRYAARSLAPTRPTLDPDARGDVWTLAQARAMIRQGYHVNRVVAKTGWGRNWFSDITDPSGYLKLDRATGS